MKDMGINPPSYFDYKMYQYAIIILMGGDGYRLIDIDIDRQVMSLTWESFSTDYSNTVTP